MSTEPTDKDWSDFAAWAERDKLDAARYRFLRDADRSDEHLPYQALLAYAGESLDAAIDAAMSTPKGGA